MLVSVTTRETHEVEEEKERNEVIRNCEREKKKSHMHKRTERLISKINGKN